MAVSGEQFAQSTFMAMAPQPPPQAVAITIVGWISLSSGENKEISLDSLPSMLSVICHIKRHHVLRPSLHLACTLHHPTSFNELSPSIPDLCFACYSRANKSIDIPFSVILSHKFTAFVTHIHLPPPVLPAANSLHSKLA